MYSTFLKSYIRRNFEFLIKIEWATDYAEQRVALFWAILWQAILPFDSNKAHWILEYYVFNNKLVFIVFTSLYSFSTVNTSFVWLDYVAKCQQKAERTTGRLFQCNSHIFNKGEGISIEWAAPADLLTIAESIICHLNVSATSSKFSWNVSLLIKWYSKGNYWDVYILDAATTRYTDVSWKFCKVTRLHKSISKCGYLACSVA